MAAPREFSRVARAAALGAIVLAVLWTAPVSAEPRYPDKAWAAAPDLPGWSADKLRAAREYAATIQTAAVMIVVDGVVLDEWGETTRRFNVHSIRNLVVVHRVNTDERQQVSPSQFGRLMQLILDAKR
jgi:hypothetical protein